MPTTRPAMELGPANQLYQPTKNAAKLPSAFFTYTMVPPLNGIFAKDSQN